MPPRPILAAALLLGACMPLRALDAPGPRTVVLRCAPAATMVATFADRRVRLVEPGGRVVELERARADTGTLYRSPYGTLQRDGTRLSWTPIAGPPLTCTAPAQA